jgi:hypothetical protein
MTWTERYLAALLRSIPGSKRDDVERELRSLIEDGIEERVAAGEDRAAAERAVLEGLGNPSQLAAAYTGQPTYLVGPELFPLYRKFVPRVIVVAAPIAGLVILALKLAGSGDGAGAIAAGISGAIGVAIQIAFWGTVTFVALEWAGPAREARAEIIAAAGTWTLERLPKLPSSRISVGETAGEIVTVLVAIGILLFSGGLSITVASGAQVPLLSRDFTTVWLPILVAVIAVRGSVHLRAYTAGSWTRWLTWYHALLQLAFGGLVVVLALSGWIVNPAVAEVIGGSNVTLANRGLALVTVLATGWEIVRIFLRGRRPEPAVTASMDPSKNPA